MSSFRNRCHKKILWNVKILSLFWSLWTKSVCCNILHYMRKSKKKNYNVTFIIWKILYFITFFSPISIISNVLSFIIRVFAAEKTIYRKTHDFCRKVLDTLKCFYENTQFATDSIDIVCHCLTSRKKRWNLIYSCIWAIPKSFWVQSL